MDLYGPGLTALRAYSTTLAVTAQNVANWVTPGYKPQRVVRAELPAGGVSVTVSREVSPGPARPEAAKTPPETKEPSPSAELAAGRVSLAREMVSLMTTQRAYEANARLLRTAEQTKGRILDLVG